MSAYLSSLVAISALVGVCSYASYGDAQDKLLKAASSFILVYILVCPAISLIESYADYKLPENEIGDYFESINDTELAENAEAAFSAGIKKHVCNRFSLSEDEVSVRVFGFDCRSMKAEKIKIILRGKAILADNRAIAEEISGNGLGECEVELSVK